MNEVYWGVYERSRSSGVDLLETERVCSAADVKVWPGKPAVAAGSGWGTYAETLSGRVGSSLTAILPERYPRAAAIARLAVWDYRSGRAYPAEQAQPTYLRDKVANMPGA
jgi:tRNA threonylcarbamoyladenosine biosynthesis protein TsaB